MPRLPLFDRPRWPGVTRLGPRSWAGGCALLAFACSVYEIPSDWRGAGGSAGVGAGNGGGSSGGTSGGISPSAGTTPFDPAGASGDPSSGGEGGPPDECPDDPDKFTPGECGCGLPDVPAAAGADCHTLKSLLAHRYDFEGTGTAVLDRVGSAHGVIARSATLSKLDGRGVVLLGGGETGAYIDLPNRLLSSLTNATLEAWVTWGGGSNGQRIFDFGDTTAAMPEDTQTFGKTYLFVTPSSSDGSATLGFSLAGSAQEIDVPGAGLLPQTMSQIVAVANDDDNELEIFIDGIQLNHHAWTDRLAQINDVNVWLGRSQYATDSELNGVFHEFRVYKAALSQAQVTSAFRSGPDPAYLAY